MAIRKEGLAEKLQAEQAAKVKSIEELIDATLIMNYTGEQITVYMDALGFPHEKVKKEITRRYAEAGWDIQYKEDERDGARFVLK